MQAPVPVQSTSALGTIILVVGILVAGLGVLLQGGLTVWFFSRPAGPFSQTFNSFEWGEASAAILIGFGVLLAGIGWTLDKLSLERFRGRATDSTGRTSGVGGAVLVLLGVSVAAAGEFLYAGLAVQGLEGVGTIANALGPGWSSGGPGVLLGVGLMLAGAGVLVLWRAGRTVSYYA